MRTSYGYSTYRGRTRTQKILSWIIAVLVLVLVLAVAAFFFLQKYMIYTDDGKGHLELPAFSELFSSRRGGDPDPLESEDTAVIVVTPTPAPTPPPEPALKAVWLLRGALTDGSAPRQVEAAAGNAAVFNMKADDGTLGYVSSLPAAIAMGTTATPGETATGGTMTPTDLNDSIRSLTASELYTIARVSCFKDNKAPRQNNTLSIRTNSGYNWQDPAGIRWMNVSSPEAREYVIGVCKELAELGFDEILLEHSGYPAEGNLHYIKVGEAYDPDHLAQPVEAFYSQLAEALKDTDVKLSVAVPASTLTEEGDASGLTPALLKQYAQRLVLPLPQDGETYDLTAAGFTEGQVLSRIPAGGDAEDLDRWLKDP